MRVFKTSERHIEGCEWLLLFYWMSQFIVNEYFVCKLLKIKFMKYKEVLDVHSIDITYMMLVRDSFNSSLFQIKCFCLFVVLFCLTS